MRFATRLPNASNESGLGLDTTDFYASVLIGKTVQSVRSSAMPASASWVSRPNGNSQNDVFTYGFSFARAVQEGVEIVGEINGRLDTREAIRRREPRAAAISGSADASRAAPCGSTAAIILGLTSRDPSFGLTGGLTWVFQRK